MAVDPRNPDEDADEAVTPPVVEDGVITPLHIQSGGQWYALKRVKNCVTCRSPFRMDIEHMLLQNMPPDAIIRELLGRAADTGKVPSRNSIIRHTESHSPLHVIQARAIREESMKALGDAYSQNIQGYVNTLGVAQLILQQGVAQLPDKVISVAEMLTAIKYVSLHEERTVSGDLTVDAAMGMIRDFIDITANFIPLEAQHMWSRALMTNPGFQAMLKESDPKQITS